MASSPPGLHIPRPNTKEGLTYADRCKATMKYDLIDIQTMVIDGVISPLILKSQMENQGTTTMASAQPELHIPRPNTKEGLT